MGLCTSLWTSELWLQDADKYGKLVLDADPIKLYHYVLIFLCNLIIVKFLFVCLLAFEFSSCLVFARYLD